MKASPFENPWILADQLANTLQNWKKASTGESYANAPEIRPPSNGEELFRTRCASVPQPGPSGRGRASACAAHRPDLIGVTRQRAPAWLNRWIREPDKMLKEKDPIAVELFERYDKISMPNLRLDEKSAQSIIEFLQEETERQQPLQAAQAQ